MMLPYLYIMPIKELKSEYRSASFLRIIAYTSFISDIIVSFDRNVSVN